MALNIPNQLHDAVVGLFQIELTKREELLRTLRSVDAGSHKKEYEKKLVTVFPDASSEWISETTSFILNIANLTDVKRNAETVTQDIIAAFRKFDSDVVKESREEDFEEFHDFILQVVQSQDSIGIRAKAIQIGLQHERLFVYSEIFSDIRPIFSQKGPKSKPESAIVTHSLKIGSLRDDRREEIFFAMNYQDLEELRDVVDRAIQKHETLSSMFEQFRLNYVETGGDE